MAVLANPPFWYVGSTKWSAVTAWTTITTFSAGQLIRATSPTAGNERVFVCIIGGLGSVSEPTWILTKGAKTTDNLATWEECTGQPPTNGDVTNTNDWNSAKSNTVALGQIIKRINAVSYQICTTAGTCGSGAEPSFSDTAGTTTADNTVTWTSLGVVGNFTAWGACFARLKATEGSGWGANGDTIYISNNHAETQSTTYTQALLGIPATPCNYLCVVDTTSPPTTLASSATITQSGNAVISLGTSGAAAKSAYFYGISFVITGSASTAFNIFMLSALFDTCGFNFSGSSDSVNFTPGDITVPPQQYNFLNCTWNWGAAAQLVKLRGNCNFIGGSFVGTALTDTFFASSLAFPKINIRDFDFSAMSGNLFSVSSLSLHKVSMQDCKLNASATLVSGTLAGDMFDLRMHNCDSGSKNYRFYTNNYRGVSQQETTIVRTGGASDGITPISINMASSAFTVFGFPFVSEEIAIWNNIVTGNLTATVEIAGAATLKNNEIWMEIEYLGNSSYPIGSIPNNRAAFPTTGSNVTSSSSAWGGSPAVTQKLQITLAPRMKGIIKARIYLAKASTTVYIDPEITLT